MKIGNKNLNKKGQFYMLIAILLILHLMLVVMPSSAIISPTSSFRQLYENFMAESPQVINSGIYEDNLTERFRNFTAAYTDYARTKSPDFNMAYALLENEKVLVSNSMGYPINITTPSESFNLSSGTDIVINRTSNLTFYIKGNPYNFAFTKDTELKAVFMKSDKNEVIIHVEE